MNWGAFLVFSSWKSWFIELSVLGLVFWQRNPESRFTFVDGFGRHNSNRTPMMHFLRLHTRTVISLECGTELWVWGIAPVITLQTSWLWVSQTGRLLSWDWLNQMIPSKRSLPSYSQRVQKHEGLLQGQVARTLEVLWELRDIPSWQQDNGLRSYCKERNSADNLKGLRRISFPSLASRWGGSWLIPWFQLGETPSRGPSLDEPWLRTYRLWASKWVLFKVTKFVVSFDTAVENEYNSSWLYYSGFLLLQSLLVIWTLADICISSKF